MKFKEKYTSTAEKEKDKIEISTEAYAVGEVVDELKEVLEKLRQVLHG